ncbi:hypothetical protein NN3_03320 [Nocardia neocaledoniensis NBRC 108232]|uniref:Uncharacterized protein DUF4190 n=1 Tax=Nocardia neocaledoniensis TaxID=236511 RepID=A0A317NNI4_9NOCA|nr:DUF4190 domain-containing protein [Nocardia neocaledoniensis]PWV76547.1 uncharacterized protein DUF4190 [Nocardia neocaledoniensis]GEM29325.1 hypothetical protein NN3_03320 [Nocardia neocaledoniensis NBRC 108232]
MTNPGDSDEWWKQYGGSGVSPESGAPGSVPQYPQQQPSQPSAPQYPQQPVPPPSQPQYPNYQQPSAPQYPQQPPVYGATPAPGYQPYGAYPQPQGTNGLAIGALVSSLVGLCTCIGSIVGIILGVMALNQIKERGGEGRGMALAGIWIGAITLVLGLLYVVFVIVLGVAGGLDSSTSTY